MGDIKICNNKYLNYSCLFLIVTTILICFYSLNTENVADYFKICTTLIMLQFVSFFCGSFLGFLFGFPSHNNSNVKEKYQRNSSLKEITSWLTKIIVGVTLIEFKDIYQYLKNIITQLSYSLESNSDHIFVIGSLIGAYFILGFIVFFILSVTTIFGELVVNDKNIEDMLGEGIMNSSELHIDSLLENDYTKIDAVARKAILKYVSVNGVEKLETLLSKRLGKLLFHMEEYQYAAKAYEYVYKQDSEEKYALLNACYIRSKFLKEFRVSNKTLEGLIKKKPEFAAAYYNLACNYNRESLEFDEQEVTENHVLNLKKKSLTYLKKALSLDEGLYSEARKDTALEGIDFDKIFNELSIESVKKEE